MEDIPRIGLVLLERLAKFGDSYAKTFRNVVKLSNITLFLKNGHASVSSQRNDESKNESRK